MTIVTCQYMPYRKPTKHENYLYTTSTKYLLVVASTQYLVHIPGIMYVIVRSFDRSANGGMMQEISLLVRFACIIRCMQGAGMTKFSSHDSFLSMFAAF